MSDVENAPEPEDAGKENTSEEEVRKVETIPLRESRIQLVWVWFIGFVLIFVPVVLMCFLRNDFRGSWDKIVSWVLRNTTPTLGLILAAWGVSAINPKPDNTRVDLNFHRAAFWMSIGYLVLVFLPIPIAPLTNYDVVELTTISGLWLGPLQALVAGVMSVLFTTAKPEEE